MGGEPIVGVNDPVVVPFHLSAGVNGTRVFEVATLVGRTALDAHGRPDLKGLLQASVAIGHHEQRRRQTSTLQVGQKPTPRRCRFGRRQLQRHQSFLAVFSDAKGREDRHRHDAPGSRTLRLKPSRNSTASPLRFRACHVVNSPFNRATIRETALFDQMPLAEERLQRGPNAPAIRAGEITAENGRVDVAGAPRIPREELAAPDGQRFVVQELMTRPSPLPITVVVNWPAWVLKEH